MLKVKNLQSILLFVALSALLCLGTIIAQAQDLPEHWESVDIGDVAAPGSATFEGDVFIVNGSGADIWFQEDAFHFAYQPGQGDCEIFAYVSSVGQTAGDAKACIMIRETLDANSAFAMAVTCPGPGFGTYFQRRPAAGAGCDHTNLDHGKSAPVWLKLVREGNTFTAYFCGDGEPWKTVAPATIEMAEDIYIGLGVCAHNNDGSLCETIFESVVVDPGIDYPVSINDFDQSAQVVSSEGYQLNQNYPNPFNPTTTIKYHLQKPGNIILTLYNLAGQELETLVNEFQTAGEHEINWQPKGLPGGIYFYRLQAGDFSETKKLILQKQLLNVSCVECRNAFWLCAYFLLQLVHHTVRIFQFMIIDEGKQTLYIIPQFHALVIITIRGFCGYSQALVITL